jgi:hypothetical protein
MAAYKGCSNAAAVRTTIANSAIKALSILTYMPFSMKGEDYENGKMPTSCHLRGHVDRGCGPRR